MNNNKFLNLIFGVSLLTAFSPAKADLIDASLFITAMASYAYTFKSGITYLMNCGHPTSVPTNNRDQERADRVLDSCEADSDMAGLARSHNKNNKKLNDMINKTEYKKEDSLKRGIISFALGTAAWSTLFLKKYLEGDANNSDDL